MAGGTGHIVGAGQGPEGPSTASELAVSVPTSATFQQSATSQVPTLLEAINAMILWQRQEYYRRQVRLQAGPPNDILSYGRESQKRPIQRPRTMDNSHDNTKMSTRVFFPDQNDVLAQPVTKSPSRANQQPEGFSHTLKRRKLRNKTLNLPATLFNSTTSSH